MPRHLSIGIIGDFDPQSKYHLATNAALQHAGEALGVAVEVTWIPTETLEAAPAVAALERFDGLWCAPGSPYASMEGALNGIRLAREKDIPFAGT